jgi:hypothetical protein
MRITNDLIESYNPCQGRYDNYLANYKNTDLSIKEFLSLDKITYNDKIWVWKKFATIDEAALFGLKCAESVLHIYENRYPEDNGLRLALESIRIYLNNPTEENKKAYKTAYKTANAANAANAAYTADADAANAANAARAAANAAANAANAARAAYTAAAAANAARAAYTAAAAAADAANAAYAAGLKKQQELNIQFLIEIYEGK